MHVFSLSWSRCLDGYRLEARPPSRARGAALLNKGTVSVVRNSERLETVENVFHIDGLYRRLAAARPTPEGARDFAASYGLLNESRAKSQPVDEILVAIDTVRALMRAAERGQWQTISDWTEGAGSTLLKTGGVGRMGAVFRHEAAGPALHLRPGSLLSAIYVQLLADLARGATLRKCTNPGCPEWFEYGPGTRHRETALYCAPRCQRAHAYLKSKRAAAPRPARKDRVRSDR